MVAFLFCHNFYLDIRYYSLALLGYLTFSPLHPSQRRVYRPPPRTTPFAATGYLVLKRTLLYESIIVHSNYSLKSLNILHNINHLGSKNQHNFLPLNVITADFIQRLLNT